MSCADERRRHVREDGARDAERQLAGLQIALLGDATLPLQRPLPNTSAPDISCGPFDDAIAGTGFVFEPLARWAVETPDKPAIVSSAGTFSYLDLEKTTNRLARTLRHKGVNSGDLVSIVLPRGPEVVLANISVLKAGAAYVPLDADSPTERIL